MMKKNNSEQNGRSMIEMLGVLAIIGVLSVGGIAGYSKAMFKYRTNRTMDQATTLIANIRMLYTNQTSFEGLDMDAADEFEAAPTDMIIKEGDKVTGLQNALGGSVTIAPTDDNKSFQVAFGGLNKLACITIATGGWEENASSGLVEMQIGTGGEKPGDAITLDKNKFNWTTKTLPITIAAAEQACIDGINAVGWTYNITAY